MVVYAIGDIHGRARAFEEVLERSEFNRYDDSLISLGDVVDGGPDTRKCFDILNDIPNKILVAGNHEKWCLNWMLTGEELPIWVTQGGYATMKSYDFDRKNVPQSHFDMLASARIYYIDEDNNLFVHGGLNPKIPIEKQTNEYLMWDRDLAKYAYKQTQRKKEVNVKPYRYIFTGHTSTQFYNTTKPLIMGNVIMLDTGAGHMGKLTMMDVDTLKYYQSESQPSCFNEFSKPFSYGGKI